MRIAHIVSLITPDGAYGGPVSVCFQQAKALQEAGHDITILAAAQGFDGALPTEMQGLKTRLYPARWIPRLGFAGLSAPGLSRWIADNKAGLDVLHIHLARDLTTLPVARVARRYAIPYVAQTHGMIDRSSRLLAGPIDLALTRPALEAAKSVFFLTDQERDELVAVSRGMAHVERLGHGISVAPLEIRTAEDAHPEVLFLARLHERKRPVTFAKASVRLSTRFPKARFRLVGPDEGESGAVQAVIDANEGTHVSWEGPVEPARVLERMSQASIYVLPSVNEPFGMSVLEAMSVGKPVVVTVSCALADIISTAEAGIVVGEDENELTEALAKLLSDEGERARLGANARRLAESFFGMGPVVAELERAYAAAMA